MAHLLDKISKELKTTGLDLRTKKARKWLVDKARDLRTPSRNAILNDRKRKTNQIVPGRMFFYAYDPKTKDTLPFYDEYPLVLPIDMYPDGFLGLNLHYIPPRERLALLDTLYSTLSNKNYDETTKLKINYNLLNRASRFVPFVPCLKRYLYGHILSNLIEIDIDEWEIAAVLPYDRFVGATKAEVYKDSRNKINGI